MSDATSDSGDHVVAPTPNTAVEDWPTPCFTGRYSLFRYHHQEIVYIRLHDELFPVHKDFITDGCGHFYMAFEEGGVKTLDLVTPSPVDKSTLRSYIDLVYRYQLDNQCKVVQKGDETLPMLYSLARLLRFSLDMLNEEVANKVYIAMKDLLSTRAFTASNRTENQAHMLIAEKFCKTCPLGVFTKILHTMDLRFLYAVTETFARMAREFEKTAMEFEKTAMELEEAAELKHKKPKQANTHSSQPTSTNAVAS
ncbi:hypothetical protein F4779DRAFT_643497 [Xylariaceae sp. FL0662B]|nr:hypothetical protein F4779DRAFT_643497 [Xylariaceae sp. FL0662B]